MKLDTLPSDGKFETYASIGNFRLCTVSKLSFEDDEKTLKIIHQPMSKGLAIEYRCSRPDEKENYIVIAFVDVDKDGYYDGYRSVGDRIEEYCSTWQKVKVFRTLLTIARELIEGKGEDIDD